MAIQEEKRINPILISYRDLMLATPAPAAVQPARVVVRAEYDGFPTLAMNAGG